MVRGIVCLMIGWLVVGAVQARSVAEDPAGGTASQLISDEASNSSYLLSFDGRRFSGPGWRRLLEDGRKALFFLVGEEHGIAEAPRLVAQLFTELAGSGYRRLLIEVSPPMASLLDEALVSGGLEGLRELYSQPGGEPAFFGMAEEAEMLVEVRASVPADQPVLWGADYEVAGDRALLHRLRAATKPAAAEAALARLAAASAAAWNRHAATSDPQYIFTFAGDAELVRSVKRAWPDRDDASAWILDTLEETLEINRLWRERRAFESNQRRAELLRHNFLRHWSIASRDAKPPRVMAKLGANHLIRGRNMTRTFDLGTLLPELASLEGGRSISLMILPGQGAKTAVLNPASWSYEAAPPKDGYRAGLEPLLAAVDDNAFTLIDLRNLRPVLSKQAGSFNERLKSVVFGFDLLLVMSGSTASTEFRHD